MILDIRGRLAFLGRRTVGPSAVVISGRWRGRTGAMATRCRPCLRVSGFHDAVLPGTEPRDGCDEQTPAVCPPAGMCAPNAGGVASPTGHVGDPTSDVGEGSGAAVA